MHILRTGWGACNARFASFVAWSRARCCRMSRVHGRRLPCIHAGRSRGRFTADVASAGCGFTMMHFTAPLSGLCAALLYEFLEAFEITFDSTRDDAECFPDVFDHTLGFVMHGEHHTRAVFIEHVKAHCTGGGRAADTSPGDALVGHLFS